MILPAQFATPQPPVSKASKIHSPVVCTNAAFDCRFRWRALAFLLKARWPGSFAEYARQELSGPGGIPLPAGNPFQVNVNVTTSGAPDQFTVIDHGNNYSHRPSERLPEPSFTAEDSANPPEPIEQVSQYDPLSGRVGNGYIKPKKYKPI